MTIDLNDPEDKCARCGHHRVLHHEDGCHYLGQHGGPAKRCGGSASGYVADKPCEGFVDKNPPAA